MDCHKANNPFATDEKRDIFFLADAPHPIKTLRSNLANSGSGLSTRRLWNNCYYLLGSMFLTAMKRTALINGENFQN